MEILGHLDQYAVLVLLFALACRLVIHMTVLVAMIMELRGSQPGERPRLLRGFAECLPFLGGPAREREKASLRIPTLATLHACSTIGLRRR